MFYVCRRLSINLGLQPNNLLWKSKFYGNNKLAWNRETAEQYAQHLSAVRDLYELFGEDLFSKSWCREWLSLFKSGDNSLEDELVIGQPPNLDDHDISAVIKVDKNLTTRMLAVVWSIQLAFATSKSSERYGNRLDG
ncbi:hypothetical protein TNIN_140631 [Trichonephila inaurata madagascariensis]|uniref:Transposase n=1 Tax=Trichonephila inaurata madagascariensis TaxID=2747483 RepID=A0A8X6XQB0_9ARAC|nr:hypothetical protein TNIN_140631 [Trichonephila inaurata madagascariensis]